MACSHSWSILISFSTTTSFNKLVKLVAGPGIEPRTRAYETLEIPLLQPAITLVDSTRRL
jgi:hypothetical protein